VRREEARSLQEEKKKGFPSMAGKKTAEKKGIILTSRRKQNALVPCEDKV